MPSLTEWRRRITPEEKYEVLAIHTPPSLIGVAGSVAAISTLLVFFIPIALILLFIGKMEMLGTIIIYFVPNLIIFTIIGWVAGIVENIRCVGKSKPFHFWYNLSWVYLLFAVCVLISFLILFIRLKFSGNFLNWLDYLGLKEKGSPFIVGTLLTVAVFILSLTFASPLEFIWLTMFGVWLAKVTPVDYLTIIEENHFRNELRYRFDEARRYQVPLSLMMMRVVNYDELIHKLGLRKVRKIQEEISELLVKSIRHTDFIGVLKGGQMRMILTYTPLRNTVAVGQRVKEITEQQDYPTKQGGMIKFDLQYGISCFTPDMQNAEELLNKASYALTHNEPIKI